MIITIGKDPKTVEISLPAEPKKIGVLISGGLDSAILFYLLMQENKNIGNIHSIVPLSIIRREGSKYFANLVIGHVLQEFGMPFELPMLVGTNRLPEHEQVRSGIMESRLRGIDICFLGLIDQLPQHMIGYHQILYTESEKVQAPLKHLNKNYIIELVKHFKQEALFYITHACTTFEIGRCNDCNGCNERAWGFSQLGEVDPSKI